MTVNLLLDRYQIQEKIGAGGFGEVFKAYDSRLGRTVAIKVLHDAKEEPECFDLLEAEAKALASVSHPNVARIHELERTKDGAWIIMEYVSGQTLRQILDQGRLAVAKVIEITVQIAGALDADEG